MESVLHDCHSLRVVWDAELREMIWGYLGALVMRSTARASLCLGAQPKRKYRNQHFPWELCRAGTGSSRRFSEIIMGFKGTQ